MTSGLTLATPFLIASLYYLLSPIFVERTRSTLVRVLEDALGEYTGSATLSEIPAHLRPSSLGETVDWTIDVSQMAPTFLLAVTGAILAVSEKISAALLGLAWGVTTLTAIAWALWIYDRQPLSYRPIHTEDESKVRHAWVKVRRMYTPVSLVGLVLNLAVVVLVLSATPVPPDPGNLPPGHAPS